MKAKLTVLGLGLLLAACQTTSTPTDLPPGTYKDKSTSVKANGTEVEKEKTTTVYRNPDGSKSATVHKTTTKDPEGLMNKTKKESITNY